MIQKKDHVRKQNIQVLGVSLMLSLPPRKIVHLINYLQSVSLLGCGHFIVEGVAGGFFSGRVSRAQRLESRLVKFCTDSAPFRRMIKTSRVPVVWISGLFRVWRQGWAVLGEIKSCFGTLT
ncbi:hypothetical protein CDAR_369301 [Caerostris darwini]|uniref:Uncharacterized protein n=1 Tax=Caerostris darwini TaxID=1538125 RepID=A0AAV4S0K8_9ARAC|nr:hypothetical protein CDAR_369301 [Caerostris darwini]